MSQLRGRSSSNLTDVGFGEVELDILSEESTPLTAVSENRGKLSLLCGAAAWSCLVYSFFSISMTLVNKVILTTYKFQYPMLLLLYQNGTCVILLQLAKYFRFAEFDTINSKKLLAWIPLNILFVLMLLTGFFSLNALSVPMATIFKNCTNILITFGDLLFYGQTIRRGIMASLMLMTIAAFLAAKSDLEFNLVGYVWALVNCAITASYVLYMPRAIADSKLNAFGRVYYNNLLSLPLVALVDIGVYNNIATGIRDTNQDFRSFGFIAIVVFSGCVGFFLSLTSFQCVQLTSPTTYSMVGSMNKVPLSILGVFIFHTQINSQSVVFITLSLLAGILYAYTKAKYSQKQKSKTIQKV